MVDTRDLKSLDHYGRAGSSPVPGTTGMKPIGVTPVGFSITTSYGKKGAVIRCLGIAGLLVNGGTARPFFLGYHTISL